MTQKLQPVRGTHDLLPDEARQFRFITEQALKISERYGYGEIATPIFEFSEVFHRTLGEATDVVTKETYSFTDRGGESLTLRPEFTASIARAFISNGLQDQLPLKFFYAGPAFRYERPQKGRQRQFHQLGVEFLGSSEPLADVETIALAYHVLSTLGLTQHVTLEINTLGDAESRANYRNQLVSYLTAHEGALSADSKDRLTRNPLRVLDSKDEGDRAIIAVAPRLQDALTQAAKEYFTNVTQGLSTLGITYVHNERLVRGLDYYNHTVFEFTTSALGAQGTVLAGGRYDGLIELMGGAATPGFGWAAGIERLQALLQIVGNVTASPKPRPIVMVPMGEKPEAKALELTQILRTNGFYVEMGFKGNLAKRLKRAVKLNASVALILGESELESGSIILKELDQESQQEIPLAGLIPALAPYR